MEVLPGDLRLPPTRSDGADPFKLLSQMQEFGAMVEGMPPLELMRDGAGELMISDGLTRATRIHLSDPHKTVPAIIIQELPDGDFSQLPRLREVEP